MELSKKERVKLIARISKASGIAQYALEAKMTDEQVVEFRGRQAPQNPDK